MIPFLVAVRRRLVLGDFVLRRRAAKVPGRITEPSGWHRCLQAVCAASAPIPHAALSRRPGRTVPRKGLATNSGRGRGRGRLWGRWRWSTIQNEPAKPGGRGSLRSADDCSWRGVVPRGVARRHSRRLFASSGSGWRGPWSACSARVRRDQGQGDCAILGKLR